MERNEILSIVDHTLLAQTATWADIKEILDDAMKYETASACIPAAYVKQAAEYVEGKLPICTVIGFPNGYHTTAVKVFETKNAIANGSSEIDMVINIGFLKDGRYEEVEEEIRQIHEACDGKILKVIIETCLLTEVCYKISDEIDSYRMPDENIQKEKTEIIISIINSDHLYPMTTDISFSDWKKTVNYYLSHGINIFEYMREHNSPTRPNENEAYVAGIYQKMFFKNPAHTAERKIVEDFGVDCNTFDKEIPYHLIRKLKNKILFFMKKDFWYILCFILFVCVVGYVVYQTFYNNNHDYISNVGLIFGALSLIWGILTSLGVFPKLKKTSRYDD